MQTRLPLAVVSAIALCGAAPVFADRLSSDPAGGADMRMAGESGAAGQQAEENARWISAEMIRGTSLIGAEVVNDAGETIGEVKDVVLDLGARGVGGISVILSVGEWLGIGGQEVSVGLDRLGFQRSGMNNHDFRVQLGMTREQIRSLPKHEARKQR